MRQQIYADPYGLDAWEKNVSGRCFVTLVDAVQWHAITGGAPRTKPPTAENYTAAGLPWFDYYDDAPTLAGAPALSGLRSVAEIGEVTCGTRFGATEPLIPTKIIPLGPHGGKTSSG